MRLIGIDLGGTAIKAGAIDEGGAVLERIQIPTEITRGSEDLLDRIAALIRRLPFEGRAGIGSPGLIDSGTGRVLESPNLACLEKLDFLGGLAQRLGVAREALALENDANAAALGEHWLGRGRNERDFLLVTLGTGVGGGLILRGELYSGPGGMAGEIGHVVVEPDGALCGCGRRGCLETLASATAVIRRAGERGLATELGGLAAAARQAAGAERDLLNEVGRDLGHGLACAVSLLDLRCFVIGGGFGAALDTLQSGVHAGLAERCFGRRVASIRVLGAELGADAGWIGAARLVHPLRRI